MQTPIAALIARDTIEDPKRFADDECARNPAPERRPVRRRFAFALRWSADRLAPLTD
jgi:hypothetical protein